MLDFGVFIGYMIQFHRKLQAIFSPGNLEKVTIIAWTKNWLLISKDQISALSALPRDLFWFCLSTNLHQTEYELKTERAIL